jgi:hypothetical protein
MVESGELCMRIIDEVAQHIKIMVKIDHQRIKCAVTVITNTLGLETGREETKESMTSVDKSKNCVRIYSSLDA